MTQATIGLSYETLATPGEAHARTEVLRAQLHAVGPDYDKRRVAAFGGLLALGRVDVFAEAKVKRDDGALKIDLVQRSRDYAPVLELAAERWEELEAATDGTAVNRLCQWNGPAGFWKTFAPYLSRSPVLIARFVEYCQDDSVVLQAPALVALSRLRPGSSLLLDCCKRVLAADFNAPKWTALDATRSTVAASKCLAATLLRRFLGARSDHGGQQQSAGAGRPTGRTGIPLVGSRGSRTRIPKSRRERATDLTACLRPTLAYQHTRNTRTACCRPCLVRHEARVEPMGLPARCIGRIPGEAGTRSRS